MILSLVWVYFRYIFIYFHTRINESSLFEFEQNFPSIKRYLSFVNRSTKTCIYFHPSFSHIINHRIFVDRFCSRFQKKNDLLISSLVLTISIDVDRTSLTGASIPQSGVAWSWRNFARAHTPRKKEKKRIWQKGMAGGKREREGERVSISIFWKTGLACLHESNFHATDLTVCVCPIMFANYLSRD